MQLSNESIPIYNMRESDVHEKNASNIFLTCVTFILLMVLSIVCKTSHLKTNPIYQRAFAKTWIAYYLCQHFGQTRRAKYKTT